MKRFYPYILTVILEIVLGLVYGAVLYGIVSAYTCIVIGTAIPFALLFARSNEKNVVSKVIGTLLISVLFSSLSLAVFEGVSRSGGEFIAEYDVTVESVNGRGTGSAKFRTPYGSEGSVNLRDKRMIITDGEEYVEKGDTIKVREYVGKFGRTYYVFMGEIEP